MLEKLNHGEKTILNTYLSMTGPDTTVNDNGESVTVSDWYGEETFATKDALMGFCVENLDETPTAIIREHLTDKTWWECFTPEEGNKINGLLLIILMMKGE